MAVAAFLVAGYDRDVGGSISACIEHVCGDAHALEGDRPVARAVDDKRGNARIPNRARCGGIRVDSEVQYHVQPKDISTELRIYWSNEIITGLPTAADIVPIMDKIITFDKLLNSFKEG